MTNSVLKQATPGGSPFYQTQTAATTNSISVLKGDPNYCGNYHFSISSVIDSASQSLSNKELTVDPTSG